MCVCCCLAADATHEQVLAYFNKAIRKTGVSAHAEMAAGSFEGERPIVTSSSGPHFRALKRAIQETWRHDGKVRAQHGGKRDVSGTGKVGGRQGRAQGRWAEGKGGD